MHLKEFIICEIDWNLCDSILVLNNNKLERQRDTLERPKASTVLRIFNISFVDIVFNCAGSEDLK